MLLFNSCLSKNFILTVKIPLITTREWQKEAAILHYQFPESYREKEMLVMADLAARKAEELYV